MKNLHTNAWMKLRPPGIWPEADMGTACTNGLWTRIVLEAQDDNVVISNVQMASKMLRGASVAPEKKSQVLFNSGGVLPPDRMETVIRVTFPKMHEIEKRTGQAVPSRNKEACHGRNMGDSGETAVMFTGATRCPAGKQRAKKKKRKVASVENAGRPQRSSGGK